MNNLDTNNNGYVDYTEFLAGCLRSKIYLKEDVLKAAFEYFDHVRIDLAYLILLYRIKAAPSPRRS